MNAADFRPNPCQKLIYYTCAYWILIWKLTFNQIYRPTVLRKVCGKPNKPNNWTAPKKHQSDNQKQQNQQIHAKN